MKDQLIQQALDALEFCFKLNSLERLDHVQKTMKALRARLAEKEPEPVALFIEDDGDWAQFYPDVYEGKIRPVPLYRAPPTTQETQEAM